METSRCFCIREKLIGFRSGNSNVSKEPGSLNRCFGVRTSDDRNNGERLLVKFEKFILALISVIEV